MASSISELAPIIQYIKYLINERAVLLIEEPEAHLHPENQLHMARLIARLVNHNVTVVITTHSEFLLEALSHLVQLSGIKTEKLPDRYTLEDVLEPQKVALHVFEQHEEGVRTSSAQVNQEEGIPQDEFNRVVDILFGQAREIDRATR